MPKYHQSWIFQLLDTDIQDIVVGIKVIDNQTFQWPINKT